MLPSSGHLSMAADELVGYYFLILLACPFLGFVFAFLFVPTFTFTGFITILAPTGSYFWQSHPEADSNVATKDYHHPKCDASVDAPLNDSINDRNGDQRVHDTKHENNAATPEFGLHWTSPTFELGEIIS
jgi:hypothetical protein